VIRDRFKSLQIRLAVRLAAVYLIATATIVSVLVYRAYETAGTLNDRELSLRAADLSQSVSLDPGGGAHLDLPTRLKAAYEAGSSTDIYAIRGPSGQIIAASPPAFGERVVDWPAATDDPSYFHLKDFGAGSEDYYGLSIGLDSLAGPLSISVARAAGADALVHSVLRDFVLDIAWVIPLLVLATLAIGVLAIRSVLKPIREVSEMAAAIGPNTTTVRLPTERIPTEITPLIAAVNRALDRLDQGFAIQRQFTANAAHELRTPLAIITAALDTMNGGAEVAKLKADVRRMNRLVEQLLRVARLDAIAIDVSGAVDLNAIATSVVEAMAPWALTQDRAIAFDGPDNAVLVKGNAPAIADAVRNLVENGITHSPPRAEVTVSTRINGSVTVADQGPGVPKEDRERIFERFWRGRTVTSQGAGLGLAIVMEIMKIHGGSVKVDDGPSGGAIFTISFSLANQEMSEVSGAPRKQSTLQVRVIPP
jgi:two-component system, OmpR family, sensor histidine kinase TctE